MNRLFTLILIGLAGLLASCGSSVSSSTQGGPQCGSQAGAIKCENVYTVYVTPVQLTLNAGDWSTISASVLMSFENAAPKPVSPQPTIKYSSSDTRVSVSSNGEVCAGQWDSRYLTCTVTPTLPSGYVTITAYDISHSVSGTVQVSVHPRAARITLSASTYAGPVTTSVLNGTTVTSIPVNQYPLTTGCISQHNISTVTSGGQTLAQTNIQAKYLATAFDINNNPIPNCSAGVAPGCVNDNDYVWTTDNANVATASLYGFVAAVNPGVTNVYATLNGTKSVPLSFVTCPPSSIEISTSPFIKGTPVGPFTTADLAMNTGDQKFVNATMTDRNGNPLANSQLTNVTSDPLAASFSMALPLTYRLAANTSGRFTFMAACEPLNCNYAVANFTSPAGPFTSRQAGFGVPIYSNVVGATVHGTTGSAVLITGTTFPDGVTPVHRLLDYDSEAMTLTQSIELANLPNSLVVSPDGTTAYLGSSAGLTVVNLSSYQASLQKYPIIGGFPTDVVTGTVLGVSPDSRYVVVSDVANGLVFLIDTTVSKAAARYTIPGVTSVTFAADGSGIWIGGAAGVYTYQATAFVPTMSNASTKVKSLAWTPDGQSYFASGDQLINYSTCLDDQYQVPPNVSPIILLPLAGSATGPIDLSATAINGVPRVVGLAGSQWLDYSVNSSSQVPIQTVPSLSALTPGGSGDVCLSTVTVNPPVSAPSTVKCTAQQISFAPPLEQAFITGVDPACTTAESVIHGYDIVTQKEIALATATPVVPLSGGVLSDGRKLYFGTWSGPVTQTAILHRIDLSTGTGAPGTLMEDDSVSVDVVPSFVAVVPR